MKFFTSAAIVISAGMCWSANATVVAADPTADAVLAHVREATGISAAKLPASGVMMTGTGTVAGLPVDYSIVFDSAGHFVQRSNGRISTASGFDGKDAWSQDIGGERRILELGDRKQAIFTSLIITGRWMEKDSGFVFTPHVDAAADGEKIERITILDFTHDATGMTGTLKIDSTTWMPTEWKYRAESTTATSTFSGVLEFNGMKFPAKVTRTTKSGSSEEVEFTKVIEAPNFLVSPYGANVNVPQDVEFDSSMPADIEVVKAPTGHLLVHPKVNGKDVGWFIFDSGAGSNVLNKETVKELGLETFGNLPAVGVGGAVMTSWSRPETITLGRVTLKNPLVVGLDLKFLDMPMGRPIAGIIGYGMFHRTVAEVDMKEAKIALFDPATYDETRVNNNWAKLHLDSRIACVEAEFEGHTGIFKLDTGAAGSTVSLHAPAVKKLRLLDDRESTPITEGGVGGAVRAQRGTLKYFVIGGHRTENVPATFATEEKGAFASREQLGNIGGKLLDPFRVVFDYQHGRIGFVKR